jgi:deoxycytidylate deaminase
MSEIIYPYLPAGREILFVPETNEFMAEAKRIRNTESTDFKNPTAAVIVKDEKIIGQSANHSNLNNKKLIDLHSKYCIRRIFKVPSGKGYFLCPGCATHKQHGESSAIRDALKKGNDTQGANLYLYGHWWCCQPCWDAMIKAGIKNVYLVENAHELFARK